MTLDRDSWRGLFVIALLFAGFALKGALIAPPPAPATEFNTSRALTRLQRILGDQRAHPVDTPADDAVRGRLIAELKTIGIPSRVQEAEDCSGFPKSRVVSCSRVRNVIATVPGTAPGPHLLLSAHYDSTPTGPGAGDDGIGVATLLEVGSLLKTAPPPRPVTLLFNEGEEYGLNGAAAFVRRDPEARQINSLINIDGRGVGGPALMHETSDPNGAAMAVYAAAATHPYANSISTDFAKLIPNSTDVVFYKPAGWTLLNYAWLGNETRYHSPGDRIEALDRDTVGQIGSEVLSATRALASTPDPASASSGRTVFTDVAGRTFIHLPLTIAATLLGLLLAAVLFLAWRRDTIGKPLLLTLGMVIGGSVAAGVAATILNLLRPGDFWRAYPLVTYLALYALLLMVMAALWARLGRGIDRSQIRAAAWLLILLLGSALSLALPGATIFFLIGPALALAGIAIDRKSPILAIILQLLAAILQFLMFAELLALVEMLLIDGPLWAFSPLAALAVLPLLVELEPTRLRPAMALTAVMALGLTAASLAMPRASAERPLGMSIDYFRDANHASASWGIATKQAPLPSDFPGRWHKGILPYNGRTRWIAPAPFIPTPVATARVISGVPAGSGRRIRIALSLSGGDAVAIRFPEHSKVLALGLPGEAMAIPPTGEPAKAMLRCAGRSCDGLVVEAILGDARPITLELYSIRFGLPPQGAPLVAARPRNAIPQYAPDSTITRNQVKL
ncbi:MAG: M28 family peptidase [Pseudomonadota bacterium]